jgi:hypothetical protein
MLGIGRNGAQCLAGRPEQNVVDDVLILKDNGCDWLRHREDHMEILGVEKLGSTIVQPLGASQRMRFVIAAMAISRAEFPQIQRTGLSRLLPSALHCSQR